MSSIVKAVISIYRRGEEKPIERYKARISVTEDRTKQGIDNFKKHLADFLGLKEQANKLGLGSFDLKLYRLVKVNGKTENYSILTQQQLDLALLKLDKMSDDNNLPPELLLIVPMPDVVHIGKSLKCSWSNWFIDLKRQKSNLVLLRTLRDSSDTNVRKQLRKLLSLECVRNKDRMAVEPIVRLTRPEVIQVLESIAFVVHSIVPEKYRYWKSNLPGACSHPVAICPGPLGIIFVLDYDFISCSTRLLRIRLHQPADVFEEKKGYKDARDVCFSCGVVFVIERGNKAIRFIDMNGTVKLYPNSLRSRTELESRLRAYHLSLEGSVTTLRQRLA